MTGRGRRLVRFGDRQGYAIEDAYRRVYVVASAIGLRYSGYQIGRLGRSYAERCSRRGASRPAFLSGRFRKRTSGV